MTDVWVVEASPLIILGQVGRLELLVQLASRLVVPDAVADEVLSGPEDSAHRALLSGWGERRQATIPDFVAEWSLGRGESAAIALALELDATAVVDDRSARRCARAVGTPVIGTLGVILRAKRRGLVDAAAPVLRSVLDAGLFSMRTRQSAACSRRSASVGLDRIAGDLVEVTNPRELALGSGKSTR